MEIDVPQPEKQQCNAILSHLFIQNTHLYFLVTSQHLHYNISHNEHFNLNLDAQPHLQAMDLQSTMPTMQPKRLGIGHTACAWHCIAIISIICCTLMQVSRKYETQK